MKSKRIIWPKQVYEDLKKSNLQRDIRYNVVGDTFKGVIKLLSRAGQSLSRILKSANKRLRKWALVGFKRLKKIPKHKRNYSLMGIVIGGLFVALMITHTTANDKAYAQHTQLQTLTEQLDQTKHQKAQTEAEVKAKAQHESELQKQIDDLNSQLQAKLEAKKQQSLASQVVNTITNTQTAYAAPLSSGDCGDPHGIMAAAGVPESNFFYVDYIIGHEGGWCGATRYNTGGSGAYGICQSLPGSKMASAGADWATNPVTQLRWCDSYAQAKGGWAASYSYWLSHSYW